MVSLLSEKALSEFTGELAEKIAQNDDAASTTSGAVSDPASLPSSPGLSEGAPASSTASPTKSQASPWTPTVSPESLKDLPSLGSLGHFAGLCSRCCFHGKGRCLNGYDCRFCHFDHEKRQRKKKIGLNSRGLVTTPIHQQLENRGFHNEAWGRTAPPTPGFVPAPFYPQYTSAPPTPQYVSAPPGLDLPCPPPPPVEYPVVNLLASPVDHGTPLNALPPTAPPASPPPALLGPISRPIMEAPQSEACLQVPTAGPVHGGSVEDWSVDKVVDWLTSTDLGHVSKSFEEHRITGDVLLELNSSDLEEIGVRALGDKKRLLRAVAQLRASAVQASCPSQPPPPPCWQAPLLEIASPVGLCPPPSTPPPSFDA